MFSKNSINSTTPDKESFEIKNPIFYYLLHKPETSQTQEDRLRIVGALSFHMQRTGSLSVSVSDDGLDESLEKYDSIQKFLSFKN